MNKKIYTLVFALIFLAVAVSAYPYQLNLTDGTLIDLNESNNATNITIYIVNQTTIVSNTINNTINNSYFNNSNVYVNNTNVTNYYWDFNDTTSTNGTFENRFSLFDARYVQVLDFNSYKTSLLFPSKAEFDALTTRVNNINVTTNDEVSLGGLWSMSILTFILSLCGIVIAGLVMKKMREDSNENEETYSL